jgi:hypothetical protein
MPGLKRPTQPRFTLPKGDLSARSEAIVLHELGANRFQVERVEILQNVQSDNATYDLQVLLHANGRTGHAFLQKDLILDYEALTRDLRKVLHDRISTAFRRLYPEWSPLAPFGKPS